MLGLLPEGVLIKETIWHHVGLSVVCTSRPAIWGTDVRRLTHIDLVRYSMPSWHISIQHLLSSVWISQNLWRACTSNIQVHNMHIIIMNWIHNIIYCPDKPIAFSIMGGTSSLGNFHTKESIIQNYIWLNGLSIFLHVLFSDVRIA